MICIIILVWKIYWSLNQWKLLFQSFLNNINFSTTGLIVILQFALFDILWPFNPIMAVFVHMLWIVKAGNPFVAIDTSGMELITTKLQPVLKSAPRICLHDQTILKLP
jgi:hypothetical protein